MEKSGFDLSGNEPDIFSDQEKVDKQSFVPAYAQLAAIIRRRISDGTYAPGSRLPSESATAKSFGVSAMTARQAVGVLVEEGLVNRVQGRGTFVNRLEVTTSNFGLDSLRKVFQQQEKLEVRIIKATIEAASTGLCEIFGLAPESSVVLVERVIYYEKAPFTYQVGYARFDPESPIVETMLDTDVLTGLFFEKGHSSFMKGELRLLPTTIDSREAEYLQAPEGENVFKLEHIFYDFNNTPSAFGWFIISPDKMPLTSRVGVWNE